MDIWWIFVLKLVSKHFCQPKGNFWWKMMTFLSLLLSKRVDNYLGNLWCAKIRKKTFWTELPAIYMTIALIHWSWFPRCLKWRARRMDVSMQLKSPGISSVVMLTGEDKFHVYQKLKKKLSLQYDIPSIDITYFIINLCRKYKLEEVNKHERLKCHCNCVRFIKAWEERLVK